MQLLKEGEEDVKGSKTEKNGFAVPVLAMTKKREPSNSSFQREEAEENNRQSELISELHDARVCWGS